MFQLLEGLMVVRFLRGSSGAPGAPTICSQVRSRLFPFVAFFALWGEGAVDFGCFVFVDPGGSCVFSSCFDLLVIDAAIFKEKRKSFDLVFFFRILQRFGTRFCSVELSAL